VVTVSVFDDLSRPALPHGSDPLVCTSPRPSWTPYRSFLKRGLDIALVLASAPVVLPLVAVFAVMIASSGGSPFFSQTRVGMNGRRFRMHKLRTMLPNAEALLEERLRACPASHAEWTRTQKLKNDPRRTSLGRFLRKTSLDELPQFYNVLVGDMSLVGPRPIMVSQVELYPGKAYYGLRPGISGTWQVSDRNECSFADRAGYDEAYAREVSLGTDLRVLVATTGVVLRGTGC
jgi:exopolysaccharide production protein ExoY